jgi:isoleucyl-tRNA synthetase
MSFEAEAGIVRELGKFLLEGSLYKGFKPVLWSTVEKTALADAEVEYKDHVSNTIYVGFNVEHSKIDSIKIAMSLYGLQHLGQFQQIEH